MLDEKSQENILAVAEAGNFELLSQQLHSGADPDQTNSKGQTILHFACHHSNKDAVELLISAGALLDLRTVTDGRTPLHTVIEESKICSIEKRCKMLEIAAALINAGADLDIFDSKKQSPFYMAVHLGLHDLAADMLEHGANSGLLTTRGFAPIHSAIENGHPGIAEMLISSGADVDIPGDCGMAPLHLTVFYGREKILDMLIASTADANCKCHPKLLSATPLIWSVVVKRSNLMQKLIHAGADANASFNGFGALHIAILTGDVTTCQVLIDSGAKYYKSDNLLQLVLALARKKQFKDIVTLFCGEGICQPFTDSPKHELRSRMPSSMRRMIRDEMKLSETLSASMHQAGFNSVNAAIVSGIAALMQEFARKVQGHDRMFLFGSFSDGWGCSLRSNDGRVDDDSDIDYTFIDSHKDMCLEEFCKNPNCTNSKVKYSDGHVIHQMDASTPNAAILSFLDNNVVDFIRAHTCCCYPPIQLLEEGYETRISPHVLETLRQEVNSPNPMCHVVSADSPRLEKGKTMRVSTTLLEMILMHNLTTVQGQVFFLLKFIIKKVVSNRVKGLKTYIAKSLLFYMLDRTREEEWQICSLISLVKQGLHMLHEMMLGSGSDDVVMQHFFLRDAAVYLKRDSSPKQEILDCISNVLNEIPELLASFMQDLPNHEANTIYFHPFVQIFLWSKFPVSSYELVAQYESISYDQTCNLVKLIIEKLSGPVSPDSESQSRHRDDLLRCIWKIPDHARTARECLETMAKIKTGERLKEAVRCISEERVHTVSKGIPCPTDRNRSISVAMAKELVRKHLETEDSAWKFAFVLGFDDKPDLRFLPDSLRPVLSQIFQIGYWHLNFDALAHALKSNSPWPVIDDIRSEFGDLVFNAIKQRSGVPLPLLRIISWCCSCCFARRSSKRCISATQSTSTSTESID